MQKSYIKKYLPSTVFYEDYFLVNRDLNAETRSIYGVIL